jgi:Domain of unknown function (DUF4333)
MTDPWWARPGGAPLPGRPVQGYPPPPAGPPRPVGPPMPRPPSPPGHYRPPTPSAPRHSAPSPQRSRRGLWIWAGLATVAIGAAIVVVAVWVFGPFDGKVLDVRQAEAGVAQILSDPIYGYGANTVTAVECNDGRDPKVEAGKGFTCQVSLNGLQRQVAVVFRDDAGTYEVDGPR